MDNDNVSPDGFKRESRLMEVMASSPVDALMSRPPSEWREFYDGITRRLEASGLSEASFFLNYGYADLDADKMQLSAPGEVFNSNSVRLVFEIVGSLNLGDRVTVDVGCGRGGTTALLAERFASQVTGVDISPEAIAFCRRTHNNPATHFKVGDALKIPLGDSCCDVVINVESSHSYADKRAFLTEVRRIIRSEGYLLHADLLTPKAWDDMRRNLKALSFIIETDRDITANVLASRDQAASNWSKAFGDASTAMANFLAVPGSLTYEQLSSRVLEYRIVRSRLCTET